MVIKEFTDLIVWQKAQDLVLNIYKLTSRFPSSEQFGITNQIRRAATSITANIAEGFSRYHYKERVNFYYNSRGSLSEVESFLITSKDLGFMDNDNFNEVYNKAKEVEIILSGLIRSTINIK